MSWLSNLPLKNEVAAQQLAETDPNGIFSCYVNQTDSYLFHEKFTKGAHLRKLSEVKHHQIQWETPYYNKVLDAFFEGYDFTGKTFLDFGCGDGRFTEFLIRKGATKIVCVDFDYNTLASLHNYRTENQLTDNIEIIHSDFDNLPFAEGAFDVILSIGVLYYLNENYEKAIDHFHRLLKHDGLLITSDPCMEGFLLRTLLFDSLEDAIDLFETRRFKETKEKTDFKFRLFDKKEMEAIYTSAQFTIHDCKGVSSFHNFLRVAHLRGLITAEQIENNEGSIWNMLNYLHESGNLHKHLIWKLKK